jgi:hypothetical protein
LSSALTSVGDDRGADGRASLSEHALASFGIPKESAMVDTLPFITAKIIWDGLFVVPLRHNLIHFCFINATASIVRMESLTLGASDLALINFLTAAVLNFPELEGRALCFFLTDWVACMNAFTIISIPLIFIFSYGGS